MRIATYLCFSGWTQHHRMKATLLTYALTNARSFWYENNTFLPTQNKTKTNHRAAHLKQSHNAIILRGMKALIQLNKMKCATAMKLCCYFYYHCFTVFCIPHQVVIFLVSIGYGPKAQHQWHNTNKIML